MLKRNRFSWGLDELSDMRTSTVSQLHNSFQEEKVTGTIGWASGQLSSVSGTWVCSSRVVIMMDPRRLDRVNGLDAESCVCSCCCSCKNVSLGR